MYLIVIKLKLLLLFVVVCHGDKPCVARKAHYGYICVCNSTYCDTIDRPKPLSSPEQFHFYSTSKESPGFNHATGFFRMQAISPHGFKFKVNKDKSFQKIRGFGGSFTDSFGYNLNLLSNETKEKVLESFFAEDGIEYTVCRVVLGSSDFSIHNYTYAPDYDPDLKSFKLDEDDYLYKIPHMKRAIDLSKKKLNFVGTAWTCPSWMKIGDHPDNGFLSPTFRQVWANYYIKVLDEFKKHGIDFWSLTTGNEPITLYMAKAMQVLVMFPEEQREWIVNNLGPALDKANYSTKLIVMDDMRFYAVWWMNSIMRDLRVQKHVIGVGLHWYTDLISSLDVLDELHEKFPTQEVIYTESSVNFMFNFLEVNDSSSLPNLSNPKHYNTSGVKLGYWKRGTYYIVNIIENLKHWTTTYIDWNLGLDLMGGPNVVNFPCDASVVVNKTSDEFYKQPWFYIMGHFSKFVLPDSVIIDVVPLNNTDVYEYVRAEADHSDSADNVTSPPNYTYPPPSQDLQYVGAVNPDGSTAILFYNPRETFIQIDVHVPDRGHAVLILEPNSLSTLLYW